jgi:hypothetical protein
MLQTVSADWHSKRHMALAKLSYPHNARSYPIRKGWRPVPWAYSQSLSFHDTLGLAEWFGNFSEASSHHAPRTSLSCFLFPVRSVGRQTVVCFYFQLLPVAFFTGKISYLCRIPTYH